MEEEAAAAGAGAASFFLLLFDELLLAEVTLVASDTDTGRFFVCDISSSSKAEWKEEKWFFHAALSLLAEKMALARGQPDCVHCMRPSGSLER